MLAKQFGRFGKVGRRWLRRVDQPRPATSGRQVGQLKVERFPIGIEHDEEMPVVHFGLASSKAMLCDCSPQSG